jgi:hypothetical protein
MASPRWALPPRGLLGLVAGMTIVPLALLSWLGWRRLEQDRQLEGRHGIYLIDA